MKSQDFQKSGFSKVRILKKSDFQKSQFFYKLGFWKSGFFEKSGFFGKSGFWKVGILKNRFFNFFFFSIFQVEIEKWEFFQKIWFSKVRILKNRDFQKSGFSKIWFFKSRIFFTCPFKQFRRNGTYMEVGFSKVPISPFGGRAEVTPLRGITFSIFHVL